MNLRKFQRGFSLIEVLVALLVFSFGLLGFAGMLVVSVKTNHTAYLRSQASFLAQSLSDRMRANVPAVWSDAYNASYPVADTNPCVDPATNCSRVDVATKDRAEWSMQLSDLLPNANATVACTAASTFSAAEKAMGAPYTGLCMLTIRWSEASLNAGAAGPNAQSMAWNFQP
jgi:type IV pilus assembly protein PilV